MKSAKQAIENMEYVRRLLEQTQPGFAASLEFAVSLAETSMEKPMDDELGRPCAAAARVVCLQMTPRYLSWSRPELRHRKHLDDTPWFRRSPDPTPRCTRSSA
jgi:hypothetical protein